METYEQAMKRLAEEEKAIAAEMDAILKDAGVDFHDLEDRFLKDFGCINFASDEYMHEVKLAREFHRRHSELFPHLHDKHMEEPYRCYHQTVCKCGYSEAVDSSD